MPPTPYMGLTLPTVGVTLGPAWATELNTALDVIDAHNHTTGNGVPIPSAGININADLTFGNNNATNLRSVQLTNNVSPLGNVSDITCLYASGGNLYYNNSVGNQVQITQGAGLDASSVGGFGGDYGLSTASAFYTSATTTFSFWSNSNVSAFMDQGQTTIHPTNSSTLGVTLSVPTTLSSSYNVVFPNAAPVSNNSVITYDTSGNGSFVANSLVPVATVIASMATATPAGYLYCNGQAVSRTTYAALFAAMGTASGEGDGSTTFNVPDMRGWFLRGQDDGAGLDPDVGARGPQFTGGNSGDNVGSTEADQFAIHTHTINDPGHAHGLYFTPGSGRASPAFSGPGSNLNNGGTTPVANSVTGITAANAGGSTETRPWNVYVRYYIKY